MRRLAPSSGLQTTRDAPPPSLEPVLSVAKEEGARTFADFENCVDNQVKRDEAARKGERWGSQTKAVKKKSG